MGRKHRIYRPLNCLVGGPITVIACKRIPRVGTPKILKVVGTKQTSFGV